MAAKRVGKAGSRRKDAGNSGGGKGRGGTPGKGRRRKAAKAEATGSVSRRRSSGRSGREGVPRKPGTGEGGESSASRTGSDAQAGELIGMDEAIGLLKTTRPTFYRWLRAGRIKGMKLGRQWRFYREDIDRFLRGAAPRIELPADISPLMETLSERIREAGEAPASAEGLEPVERAAQLMIALGAAMGASDVHITPHMPEGASRAAASLRYRVDGVLHEVAEIDMRLLPAVVAQFKRMAACDVHDNKRAQDGRILMKLSGEGKAIDLRVCFLPACLGESVTVRILDPAHVKLELESIDYSPKDRERLLRAIRAPWGLVVVTGPTGCGKTTTLYSCLNEVASPALKTVSVEEPVEYLLPWVTQVQVMTSSGLTFARAARAALRSDPDAILLGEVRDAEALWICHQAALTGHLVLTTLHTDEAASALVRMVEIGVNPFVVGDATKLVLAQRLIRKLCPHCAAREKPGSGRLARAAELARKGGLDWDRSKHRFRSPAGCAKCSKTGYKGRSVIAETLEVTPDIGRALREGASVDEIREIAVRQGMTTMAADGVRRAAAGETSLDEVMGVIG